MFRAGEGNWESSALRDRLIRRNHLQGVYHASLESEDSRPWHPVGNVPPPAVSRDRGGTRRKGGLPDLRNPDPPGVSGLDSDRRVPPHGQQGRVEGDPREPGRCEGSEEGTLPLPDGAMLAKLAWKRGPMPEFQGAFMPGASPRLEFMVKDSKKYAATGGWGFARFIDGKPADEAAHKTCFPCHEANVKGHDFVFTRFAP